MGSSETAVLAQATEDKPLAELLSLWIPPRRFGRRCQLAGEGESEVLLEKTLNLEIATKVQEELTRLGAEVRLTRSTDEKHSYFYIMAYTADLLLQRYAADIKQAGYNPNHWSLCAC